MEEAGGSRGHDRCPSLSLSPVQTINLILIGEREAGKSAAGNAILGTMAFDQVGVRTRKSVRQEGVVRGMHVVVVDTPGWEWFNLSGSSASSVAVRKEMISGMTLCHPGAHALLLVVPLSFSFSPRERRVVEEHIDLFGPQAWRHTLVLFTVMDTKLLHDSALQDEVELNTELQQLVEKCSGRYHALHGRPKRGEDQVAELLSKIHEMAFGDGESMLLSDQVMKWSKQREEEEERQEEEERRRRREEMMQRVKQTSRKREVEKRMRGNKIKVTEEEENRQQKRDMKGADLQDPAVTERVETYFTHFCKTQ
ncbi:GTPase IMAP family member 4-like [Tachysurus fulvidraco]|uniref:GTPase IMAP family member 4-like n=1 Tax=Tachysurus fulvidraco TaxID=1234273 RepID=UPI000F4E6625|nr:GTPase IMAP family member 4-like [Tachysurus fulvidraco]